MAARGKTTKKPVDFGERPLRGEEATYSKTPLGRELFLRRVSVRELSDHLGLHNEQVHAWISGKEDVPSKWVVDVVTYLNERAPDFDRVDPTVVRPDFDFTYGATSYGRTTRIARGEFLGLFEQASIDRKGNCTLKILIPPKFRDQILDFLNPVVPIEGLLLNWTFETPEAKEEEDDGQTDLG